MPTTIENAFDLPAIQTHQQLGRVRSYLEHLPSISRTARPVLTVKANQPTAYANPTTSLSEGAGQLKRFLEGLEFSQLSSCAQPATFYIGNALASIPVEEYATPTTR